VTEPSGAVFLSYASEDGEAVRRIGQALQARGIEALALDLSDSTLQRRYGALLASLGRRSGGIAAINRATELDPLSSPRGRISAFTWSLTGNLRPPTKLFAGSSKSNRRRPIR
jgi:hypothetical protein